MLKAIPQLFLNLVPFTPLLHVYISFTHSELSEFLIQIIICGVFFAVFNKIDKLYHYFITFSYYNNICDLLRLYYTIKIKGYIKIYLKLRNSINHLLKDTNISYKIHYERKY